MLGAGSSTITIEGVEELTAVEHTVVPDRIEAATFLAALGVAGGEITLEGARADHMDMLIEKLGEMGMRISPTANGLWAMAPERLHVDRRVDAAVSRAWPPTTSRSSSCCCHSPTASAS